MSSYITLNHPITDIECFKDTLKKLNLEYTISKAKTTIQNIPFDFSGYYQSNKNIEDDMVMTVTVQGRFNRNITFARTGLGFTARVSYYDQSLVNKIFNTYDALLAEKIRRLKKEKETIESLLKESERKHKLILQASLKEKAKLKDEIEKLKEEQNKLLQEKERLLKEQQKQIEENQKVKENITRNIEEKAKKLGYRVEKKKEKNKTKLILVRVM